jgi:ZIP family zinc transporter
MDLLVLLAAATATALATGLGVPIVWWHRGSTTSLTPFLEGATGGIMAVAAIVGLLLPAFDDGSPLAVGAGVVAGIGFLLGTRRWLGQRRARATRTAAQTRAALTIAVLFVHSLPEGMAIGAAFAADRAGLDVFVTVAIALQNVPEGTATAIPMAAAGASRRSQLLTAIATSLPQPVGAVLAYVAAEQIGGLLPLSLAFAAGAMLALVVVEVAPAAWRPGTRRLGSAGALGGAALMLVLTLGLGVA